ncbi:hypothetical protein BDN70DRAFT_772967, partial [Pholiota conissans]
MIGCNFMARIHEALCIAKENNLPFGGIHIIFAGDFAQLPPVQDTRLYSRIDCKGKATFTGQHKVFGKLLWLTVNQVVILTQIMRQVSDDCKPFVSMLSRLRTGNCTADDYNMLNSQIVSQNPIDSTDTAWANSPVVVSNNDTKDALNEQMTKEFAAKTGQEFHYYYAKD